MKYLLQFGVILAVSVAAEAMNFCIPLPIPASIYGLVLMLVLLKTGLVKLEHIKETGDYLLQIMPLLFLPPAVGLLVTYTDLLPILFPAVAMLVLSTVLTMVVTGHTAQFVIRKNRGKDDA